MIRSEGRGSRIAAAIGVLALSAAVVSGCASNSGSPASPDSSGGPAADVEAAQALVDEYSKPITSVDLPPLSRKPEAGKTVAIVTNNTVPAVNFNNAAKAAAEELGWTGVQYIFDTADPTALLAAYNQALADAPDAMVTTGNAITDYSEAARGFAEAGIPVVTSSNPDPIEAPTIANVNQPEDFQISAELAAAYVVAEAGDDASVALFSIPQFEILSIWVDAFEAKFGELCPNCNYEEHPIQTGDIGTKVPQQVVSVLQRDPSINFVVMDLGDTATGVSGALSSAGFDDVQILGGTPAIENIAALINGTESMWVGLPAETFGWKSIDALARYFNEEDVAVASSAAVPYQIIVPENAPNPAAIPEVVDYQSIFRELWLVN